MGLIALVALPLSVHAWHARETARKEQELDALLKALDQEVVKAMASRSLLPFSTNSFSYFEYGSDATEVQK